MSETNKSAAAMKRFGLIGGALAIVAIAQWQFNIIPMRASKEAVVPLAVELPQEETINTAPIANLPEAGLPSTTPTKLPGSFIRISMYAWTAQLGLNYANGGPKTTVGSLMEKNSVKVQLITQGDLNKSQAEQIKFAEALANGDSNPSVGTNFIIMMGDGAAQYKSAINKALTKLGPDYYAETVGAVGFSGNKVSGEDACMGPAEWQNEPDKAKGGLIAGYLRDGDWNLCLYWAQQNGIKNNPDETTYDHSAINWVSTSDHLDAADKYITGYCEDRKVVKDGKLTGDKLKVCVNGVATWTPGDVNIAKQKGGLVKLISTKENFYQMPATLIGIHKWNEEHPKAVKGILKAAFEGADQVRSFRKALQYAGKASFAVYGEKDAAYWVTYYEGRVERDKTNQPVPLGGSRVANLGDNLAFFGLGDGTGDPSSSMWRATYEGFGNVARQQYPKLVPEFPDAAQATNLRFLQELSTEMKATPADLPEFTESTGQIADVVARKNWSINFATGQATFTPDAVRVLDDLYNQLSIGRLSVDIEGHTDNTGDASLNTALSFRRAEAVKAYLTGKAPALFPSSRVNVEGYGASKPEATNDTPSGRALNRRVTIIIGNR